VTEYPKAAEDLASILSRAAAKKKSIELGGAFTKRAGAGPIAPPDVIVSTSRMNRILAYEPRDLTISVEAGLPYSDLSAALAANGQMLPFDPPFSERATIGGVVASNSSGPRRRLYGTVRDLVIGMKYATLEGKLVQSGGMVVKNVAGLDTGKLMIGSWGTLAAIASVNFKVLPVPAVERTFVVAVDSPAAAFEIRGQLLRSVLQPCSIDFVNLLAAGQLGYKKAFVAIEFGGNQAVIARSESELAAWTEAVAQAPDEARKLWQGIQNFTPRFLEKYSGGVVVRVSTTLTDMPAAIESLDAPVVARAGSGVIYAYFSRPESGVKWMAANPQWTSVVEYAPAAQKEKLPLWPSPGNDMELMKRVKQMFDPENLLNRGRYYRHF
jgi:glycolate oxidase FAD binding subunit